MTVEEIGWLGGVPALAAVLLLLMPALPPFEASHQDSNRSSVHNGVGAWPNHLGSASTSLQALNLSWNATIANPLPSTAGGPGGKGLAEMASNGTTTLLFGSVNSGLSYVPYTRLYSETNNTWFTLSPATQPPALVNFSLASDGGYSNGVAVLFDGANANTGQPVNQTWLFYFRNDTWRSLTFKAGGPTARDDAALAADGANNQVMMIGGYNSSAGSADDDWWVLDLVSQAWTYVGLAPPIVPSENRYFGSALLSSSAGRFVLFGGCSLSIPIFCSNYTASIFKSGGKWKYALNATAGPGPRAFGAWVWDPIDRDAVLFGGENLTSSSPGILGDTWVFLPTKNLWVKENTPPPPPSSRYLPAFAWVNASSNETLLLTGGILSTGIATSQVWRLSPTLNLEIRVNDSRGKPLAGAIASVLSDGKLWLNSTNASGIAMLYQVAPGPTLLTVNASGYYQNITRFTTQPGIPVTKGFYLTSLPQLIVRSWGVFLGKSTPLPSVTLFWNSSTTPVGTTTVLGYWNVTRWHGGKVTLTGVKIGYATASNSTTIATTGDTFLNLTLKENAFANLSVFVTNLSGVPIGQATVNVTNTLLNLSRTGKTDASGHANFTGLLSGINVTVTATANTYYQNGTVAYLAPGATHHTQLNLTRWPSLHLRVMGGNLSGGPPIPVSGAKVYRNSTQLIGTTGSQGWLNVTLPPGVANISAQPVSYFHAGYGKVTLNRTGIYNLTLLLVPWPSLHVDVLGTSIGSAAYALSGARVFRNLTAIGATGATGWLNLTQIPGKANVSATFTGYVPAWKNVVLNYTGVLNVTLTLRAITGNLAVDVMTTLGPTGNGSVLFPLASADVNVTARGGGTIYYYTLANGWANESVPEGNYSVVAWKYGFKPAPAKGPFYVGNVTESFILYPIEGANVSVLVHDKNTTKPIFNATVQVGSVLFHLTGRSGWANFTNILPPGRYAILAEASGYYPNSTSVSLTFKMVIPRLLLNLTPLHQNSAPLPGNETFSLLPPQEKYTWWPFIFLPIAFAIGCALVILAQRSSRESRDQQR